MDEIEVEVPLGALRHACERTQEQHTAAITEALRRRFSAHLAEPPAMDMPVAVRFTEDHGIYIAIEMVIDEQGTAEYGGFLEAVEQVEWDARMRVESVLAVE
ncbi:MAG: hypothetical protein GY772_29560 [bacterium]|nr:hypothetical protein [bacterium]